MDMTFAMTTPEELVLEILLLGFLVSGPTILFVFRRHFAGAPERYKFVRAVLLAWTAVAGPVLAGYALIIALGGVEAIGTLGALLQDAW